MKLQGFYKGVNLGGWFSQGSMEPERLDSFVQQEDMDRIAGWGADHVRIPVDYELIETQDGTPDEAGLRRLDHAFAMAERSGLHVVLDLHKTPGFSFDFGEAEKGFFDSEALQERFYRIWETFAQRYGSRPGQIAFELLNEVTDRAFMPTWKRVAAECIRRIRQFAPDTWILVGGYDNNAAWAVPDLDAPCDDKIVYNFHCYEPLKFTHQGATWTPVIDPAARLSFAESGTTPGYFRDLFAAAVEKAQKHGVPLYCGEYGVIDRVPPEDTKQWYQCIHSVLEEYGIARCTWTYQGLDFGLTDPRLDPVRDEILLNL